MKKLTILLFSILISFSSYANSDVAFVPSVSVSVESFLNDFNSRERANSVTQIVYNSAGVNQALQTDELSEIFEDLRRQQKLALRRQSEEMKKMLKQQNRELMRQQLNYNLINNWKPLGTR